LNKKKIHTDGTNLQSNITIVERSKIDTSKTRIPDWSIPLFGAGT